jgi:hypothetical protein
MEPLDFIIYLNPAYGQYELHIALRSSDGRRRIARGPVTYAESTPGTYNEPFMRMEPEDAQKLMDALWNTGIRPGNGEGSVGQIGAMQKHLDDMRAIVAKELGVTL